MDGKLPAALLDLDEFADGAVEVPSVVRQFLVVVFELAGIGIEGDDRGGVEVVARPRALVLEVRARPVVERRGIGGAPPQRIALSVEGAGHPAAAAARLPGLMTPSLLRLGGGGHGEESP